MQINQTQKSQASALKNVNGIQYHIFEFKHSNFKKKGKNDKDAGESIL